MAARFQLSQSQRGQCLLYESKQYGTDNQVDSKHSQSAALLDIACSSRCLTLCKLKVKSIYTQEVITRTLDETFSTHYTFTDSTTAGIEQQRLPMKKIPKITATAIVRIK